MRLDTLLPINNADFLLTIEGLTTDGTPAYFTTFSGIDFELKGGAEYSDGLSNIKRYADGGIQSYSNVTIGKPYDPDKDQPVIDFILSHNNGEMFTFRCRPIKRVTNSNGSTNEFRGNKSWDLSGCRLAKWSTGKGIDTGDGTKVVMLEIEFKVETVDIK